MKSAYIIEVDMCEHSFLSFEDELVSCHDLVALEGMRGIVQMTGMLH